jgi:tyrosinase
VPEDRRVRRLAALGAAVPARPDVHALKGADMTSGHTPELIGSSEGSVHVTGETDAPVRLDKSRTNVLHRSLQRALRSDAAEVEEPPRVFLKLENIRGTSDAALYYVYIDIPPGANRAEYADRLAGTVSLFGISAASDQNGPHAGSGINQVLEISQIVDALDLSGDELAAIDVRFVPANETTAAADFSIGRISVFMLE